MTMKLDCILLVDDNADDNFYHERVIRKADCCHRVVSKTTGAEALEFLDACTELPDLILLDINMPGMNGWEFLEAYRTRMTDPSKVVIIVMLTTSINPDDYERSVGLVSDFRTKPLNREMLLTIIGEHFDAA